MDLTAELELVQAARRGEVDAFEALYRAYNNRIYNFARRMTGSEEDAGDVTQETFIRAWNALPRLRAGETFGVWLHQIALNRCRDVTKKRGRECALSLDGASADCEDFPPREIADDSPTPEQILISDEANNAVRRALDTLSMEHRAVVAMHHMEDMDVEGIAAVLGIPKGTVMSRLSRAREALRRKLAPYVEVTDHESKRA